MGKFETLEVSGLDAAIHGMRNPKNSWARSDTKSGIARYVDAEDISFLVGTDYAKRDKEDETDMTDERFIALQNKYDKYLFENGILQENKDLIKYTFIGPNDMKLAQTLIKGGDPHYKFLRQVQVIADVVMPAYWWAEFDTYKVGVTRDSCSIQHKGTARPWTLSDFTIEKIIVDDDYEPEEYTAAYTYDTVKLAKLWDKVIKQLNSLAQFYNETKDYSIFRMMRQLMPMGVNYQATISLNYAVLRNMYYWRKNHPLSEWSVEFVEWVKTLPYADDLITIGID